MSDTRYIGDRDIYKYIKLIEMLIDSMNMASNRMFRSRSIEPRSDRTSISRPFDHDRSELPIRLIDHPPSPSKNRHTILIFHVYQKIMTTKMTTRRVVFQIFWTWISFDRFDPRSDRTSIAGPFDHNRPAIDRSTDRKVSVGSHVNTPYLSCQSWYRLQNNCRILKILIFVVKMTKCWAFDFRHFRLF